jgi:sec-independent protein translocase protein TatA
MASAVPLLLSLTEANRPTAARRPQENDMVRLALFGPIGAWEIILILAIVVFLFGARRIPEIARGLGEGIRGFRSSLKGDDSETPDSEPNNDADK